MRRKISNIRYWGLDILAFAAIFFVVQLLVSMVVAGNVAGIFDDSGAITDYGFCMLYTASMLPILLLVTRYESWRYRFSMPIKSSVRGLDPTMVLWGVVLLIATNIALTPVTAILPIVSRDLPLGGWTLFTVCVVAPIMEEIIFRGRLYSLMRHSTSALMSAMLSALLFGAVHGSPQVIVEGFVAGLIFSYAYILKGSIIAPIILHMCNNALAYSLIILSYQDKSAAEIIGEHVDWSVVYTVSLVVALLGMTHVVHTIRRKGRVATKIVSEGDIDVVDSDDTVDSQK